MTEPNIAGKALSNKLYQQQHQLQLQQHPESQLDSDISAALVYMTADPISLCFWICLQVNMATTNIKKKYYRYSQILYSLRYILI